MSRNWLCIAVTAFMTAAMHISAVAQAQPTQLPAVGTAIAGPVLMVSDLEQSLKFYIDGLGMGLARRLPGNPGPGATVTVDGKAPMPFLLLRQIAKEPARSGTIMIGNGLSRVMLLVSDSKAVASRLDAAGYAHGPVNSRGIFFIRDPDGYSYEVMQHTSVQ